ncbi:K+-transporting ATPase ATPase C chain [Microlunatus sagamiharensis]|uniref:Potassium-transporting ATPase KdpC subunit n=1 Tax=Microlunatus sagamiharensis TaxID=546874 RepID=A0A1H2LV60_9ACTN|nr:K+-transporting ATPase ATPase C chain [Microlunatus sagamiharensis]
MRSSWLSTHLAAVRALFVLTVLLGLVYPLAVLAVSQLPGLRGHAEGSLLRRADGTVAGSSLIGQSFTDADGTALPQYFQTRPSAAGDGYDPTATSASNLGPEDVVDTLPDPAAPAGSDAAEGSESLLTQVCARSAAVGETEGVDGSRPFCTADGVGAVLVVFRTEGLTGPATKVVSVNQACPAQPFVASYEGVRVECATPGDDYSHGVVTPVRGTAPTRPAVPADAVTASGSGLDPDVSPAYARLQVARVARERGASTAEVEQLVAASTTGRALGFLGEPVVNVVTLNAALDTRFPRQG